MVVRIAIALAIGGIVGALLTAGGFLVLDEAATASHPCQDGYQEATFAMPQDNEVRVCYPSTWFTETLLTIDSDGREVPAKVGVLKAFRAGGDQLQFRKPQYVTWTLAEVAISPPPATDEPRPTGCGSEPLQREGDLMTCHSAGTGAGPEPSRPIFHNVLYVTDDNYFIRARVELLFDLLQAPTSEQYSYLEETWPTLQAEIEQIARDFASREGDRK